MAAQVLIVCVAVLVAGCREPAPSPRLQIVYSIDLSALADDRVELVREDLVAGLAAAGRAAEVWVRDGGLTISPGEGAREQVLQLLAHHADVTEPRACPSPRDICVGIAASYAATLEKAALANAISTIRARLADAKIAHTVVDRGGQIIVTVPPTDDRGAAIRALLARPGKLDFQVVDDGAVYMRRVHDHVALDARARELEITAQREDWRALDNALHTDYFLSANNHDPYSGKQVIEGYLRELATRDAGFRVPGDRMIGYEQRVGETGRPFWRTYYLERAVRLRGAMIADARGEADLGQPIVLVEFGKAGAQALADVTAAAVGKKLATVLDGTVWAAPVINERITGGRMSIAMGVGDAGKLAADRDELVRVLRTGALPGPVREESMVELR